MGGKPKPQQLPFESNTQYTDWTPKDTADIQSVRNFDTMPESVQPGIQAQYDRARERSSNRWNSAYNQNIPGVARNAMLDEQERGLTADEGAATAQAAFDAKDADLRKNMFLAELTSSKPLQTRQSGYNSQIPQSNGGGFWGQLAGAAIGTASKFI